MRNLISSAFLAFALLALPAAADPLPANRKTDWTFTGVPGGIPNRTAICATFSPGATAGAINSALSSCSNGVVFLNAGTYSSASLGGTILVYQSNVTLRGAGANQTILTGAGIVNLGNGYNVSLGTAITGGATQGSTTFTVASTANLAPGTMIEVERADDPNLVVNTGNQGGGTRNMNQVNMITAVNGLTITVRNPFIYDFSTGSPTVKFYFGGVTQYSGVENLRMDHTGFSGGYNSLDEYCDSCWFKGVESSHASGYHFVILGMLNLELRDSFVHDGATGPDNSGFNFYGNYLYGSNSSAKIENNIFNNNFPAIELNGSSSGFYIGYNYNYGSNGGGGGLVTWTFDDGHAPFNLMNLYEGNIGEMWGADSFFGGTGYGTALRNYFTGYNPNYGAASEAVWLDRLAYDYNIVGNVLGSTNQSPTAYIGCSTPAIYRLGYPNLGNCSLVPNDGFTPPGGYPDPKVAATLLRWGNYDYFNKATQFNAAEIPSGVPVPGDQVIPNSYYYLTIPSWWSSGIPWPPIGPDVASGNGDTSGHVNKTPAQVCWESSNLLNGGTFNAATCYGQATSAPVITSSLSATGTAGTAFAYAITASNNPTSFNATGLPAGLSVNTATGTISGTPSAAGTSNVAISATNANGTGSATLSLTINPAMMPPAITSPLTASGTTISSFSYMIAASNNPTSFGASGLPSGLTVNTSNGIISGTPASPGTFNIALSATNAAGTGTATLVLTVTTPVMVPAITSSLTASGTVGTAFSYAITASNNPTSFNATGLPSGLAVNTATGAISGTPTAAGTSNVAISATNSAGTGNATLVVTIKSPSSMVLLGSQTVQGGVDSDALGQAEAFQATATASGTLNTVSIYLDRRSTVSAMYAGVYTNNGGHPGVLLGEGYSSGLIAGTWNVFQLQVTPSIVSGTKYWIAIIGVDSGSLQFRDGGNGCLSETSQSTTLHGLPYQWITGGTWKGSCVLSGYGKS